jgi:beta-glucanase (GH16 family)
MSLKPTKKQNKNRLLGKAMFLLPLFLLIVAVPLTVGYLYQGDTQDVRSRASGLDLQPIGQAGGWTMLFDDEFNGTALDASKWAPYWFSEGSIANNTKMLSTNVSESDGNLNLTVKDTTGGIVSTNPQGGGHFQFTYGYAEARIYLPTLNNKIANWPAWWTDGQNWPSDGEMDIMEGLGGSACYHFHSTAGGPGGCSTGNYSGWHTYGADWEPGSVTYYYDGEKVGSLTTDITSSPMYLILENSTGQYSGPIVKPATMQIDYVRVWKRVGIPVTTSNPTSLPISTPTTYSVQSTPATSPEEAKPTVPYSESSDHRMDNWKEQWQNWSKWFHKK